MSANSDATAPTGRKKRVPQQRKKDPATGKDAALDHASQNTSRHEGAKGGGELPTGWQWVTLREIAEIAGGVTKGQKRRANETVRTVPYLRVANVQRGYLDLSEVKEIDASERQIEALCLRPGDILFNEGGDRDKLGRGWIWNGELPECVHQKLGHRELGTDNQRDSADLLRYPDAKRERGDRRAHRKSQKYEGRQNRFRYTTQDNTGNRGEVC